MPKITVGSLVAVQDTDTKRLDIYGVVISVNDFRKYVVKTSSGRVLVRNRRFMRKRVPASLPVFHECERIDDHNTPVVVPHFVPETRSRRNARKPVGLIEDPDWC